ncbi:hypothetical protein B0H14DRAFT_3145897 [Mycena olivaceomarginata]|nr:hypothetical protein B0H14DRAFT_3145897 [Mycena olivaceomarginata]
MLAQDARGRKDAGAAAACACAGVVAKLEGCDGRGETRRRQACGEGAAERWTWGRIGSITVEGGWAKMVRHGEWMAEDQRLHAKGVRDAGRRAEVTMPDRLDGGGQLWGRMGKGGEGRHTRVLQIHAWPGAAPRSRKKAEFETGRQETEAIHSPQKPGVATGEGDSGGKTKDYKYVKIMGAKVRGGGTGRAGRERERDERAKGNRDVERTQRDGYSDPDVRGGEGRESRDRGRRGEMGVATGERKAQGARGGDAAARDDGMGVPRRRETQGHRRNGTGMGANTGQIGGRRVGGGGAVSTAVLVGGVDKKADASAQPLGDDPRAKVRAGVEPRSWALRRGGGERGQAWKTIAWGGRQELGNNLSCRPSGLHTEKHEDADYCVNNTQIFATNFQSASGHLHPAAERRSMRILRWKVNQNGNHYEWGRRLYSQGRRKACPLCISGHVFRIHSQNRETGRKCFNEPVELKTKNEHAPVHWPEDGDCAYESEVALDTVWTGRPVEGTKLREGMSQHALPTRNNVVEALRGIINRREDERGVGVRGHRPAQTLVKAKITGAEIDGKRC